MGNIDVCILTQNHDYFLGKILYTVSCSALEYPFRKCYIYIRYIGTFANSPPNSFSFFKSGTNLNTVSPKLESPNISLLSQPIFIHDKTVKTSTIPSPPSSCDWQTIFLPILLCFPTHRNWNY